MYTNTDQIWVLSRRTGYIPQFRMSGPIAHPLRVPVALCAAALTAGVDLLQYDPVSKVTVKLSLSNLYDDNKFQGKLGLRKVKAASEEGTDSSSTEDGATETLLTPATNALTHGVEDNVSLPAYETPKTDEPAVPGDGEEEKPTTPTDPSETETNGTEPSGGNTTTVEGQNNEDAGIAPASLEPEVATTATNRKANKRR